MKINAIYECIQDDFPFRAGDVFTITSLSVMEWPNKRDVLRGRITTGSKSMRRGAAHLWVKPASTECTFPRVSLDQKEGRMDDVQRVCTLKIVCCAQCPHCVHDSGDGESPWEFDDCDLTKSAISDTSKILASCPLKKYEPLQPVNPSPSKTSIFAYVIKDRDGWYRTKVGEADEHDGWSPDIKKARRWNHLSGLVQHVSQGAVNAFFKRGALAIKMELVEKEVKSFTELSIGQKLLEKALDDI